MTLTHDSTYIYIVIDLLFINKRLNMTKSLSFLKSPRCVSNPPILQNVRKLQIHFQFTWNFRRKFRISLKKTHAKFCDIILRASKVMVNSIWETVFWSTVYISCRSTCTPAWCKCNLLYSLVMRWNWNRNTCFCW